MKFQISTNNFSLTPDAEDYLKQKLAKVEKLTSRLHGESLSEVSISRISHHREGETIELVLNLYLSGRVIRTQEKGDNLYVLIDIVEKEITRQLKTKKEKQLAKVRKGARQARGKIILEKG